MLGLSSPAHTPTRTGPHGVRKLSRIALLGQSLCMAARRPWTLFISLKKAGGAFFCGNPGALAQLGAPQGVGGCTGKRRHAGSGRDSAGRRHAVANCPLQAEKAPRKSSWGEHTTHGAPRSEGMGLKGAKPGPGAAGLAEPARLWSLGPWSPVAVYWPSKDVTN